MDVALVALGFGPAEERCRRLDRVGGWLRRDRGNSGHREFISSARRIDPRGDPREANPRQASLLVEVALDRGRAQQFVDALGLRESLVDAEADVGREFQIDAMGDLAAQIFLLRSSAASTSSRRVPPSGMT